ncbi:MAG TPA: sigma-70 family RNA polymerase sigma factor [Bacillales bacterium]|nr:sigma-70 family RNA polymerase sigma factor [Bacillales bacterium]
MDEDKIQQLLQHSLDQHYEEILNFMYLRVGNRAEAEDLTQDTYLASVKAITGYRQEASLRTWIFSIARRTLADAYERKTKGRKLMRTLKHHFRFQHHSESHEENAALFSILETLPQDDRELVILKHYFGFTYNEMAEMTGLTASNIGVKLSRAAKRLKSLAKGGDHEPV